MASTGPRREKKKDPCAALARDRPPLVRLERHECPGPGVKRLSGSLDVHAPVDDDEEHVLLDLVLAELLSGLELDQNGTALCAGQEDGRRAAAAGCLDLGQRPALHRA